jgi:hypothetical protein
LTTYLLIVDRGSEHKAYFTFTSALSPLQLFKELLTI